MAGSPQDGVASLSKVAQEEIIFWVFWQPDPVGNGVRALSDLVQQAQGNFHEAEGMLLDVIARTSKPEIQQALGKLYLCGDQADNAEPLFDSALAIYLDSMREADLHYLHHLADFYSE